MTPLGLPRLSIEGPVARITLDRPEQHHGAPTTGGRGSEAGDVARFRAHLADIAARPDVRVLVLTGTGSASFCSGASLAQMESGEMTGALFETLADDLARIRIPSICALNGSAFGGGTELALCCDFRIGVTGSRMSVPAARLGLCYPLGGLRRYVTSLGLGAASRLLLAAEELDTDGMLAVGFLHRAVPPGELESATRDLASRLAGLAPLAVQAMKRILRDIAGDTLDEATARALIERCSASEDAREGIRARREGRTPDFRGH